jgi:hypothetical protein
MQRWLAALAVFYSVMLVLACVVVFVSWQRSEHERWLRGSPPPTAEQKAEQLRNYRKSLDVWYIPSF